MQRKYDLAALLVAAALASTACGGGSQNAAGGAEGEAMQEEAGADGYPDVRMEADGGSVSDSTGGYMDASTGATGTTGTSTGGGSPR